MLLRYDDLAGDAGQHGAIPAAVFDVLRRWGCDAECCATPFNATLGSYCSPFRDTDAPFGSVGSRGAGATYGFDATRLVRGLDPRDSSEGEATARPTPPQVLRVRARERLLRDQPALHAQLRRRRAPPAHAPRRRGARRAAPYVRHGPRGRARAPRARRRDAGASRRPSPASRTLRETIERKPGASGTSRARRRATGRARATSATTSCSPRGRTTTARASSTPGPCPAPTCRRCRPSCSSSRRTRARGGGRRRASSRPPSRTRSPGRCGGLRAARRRRGGGCRSNHDGRGRIYGR